jgi:hypothetical protein
MGEVPTTIFIPRMHVPVMHNFLVHLVSTLRGESSMQLRVLDVKVARNQNAGNRYVKGRCRVAEVLYGMGSGRGVAVTVTCSQGALECSVKF